MKHADLKLSFLFLLLFIFMSWMVKIVDTAYIPTTIDDFFLPGSQPLESGTFASPEKCSNCHGGYDQAVEPSFNYQGSMMAHSMRDPLFEASMTIANQDALFSGDLCIRCHSPRGWLEGRSTPTDGSALTNNDYKGIQCHFCHKLVDPLSTTLEDLNYINTIDHKPTQHGNGMYVVDSDDNTRRGPYDDAVANHPTLGTEFFSKSELCATCHDVSNPVFTKAPDGTYQPNSLGTPATSFDKYTMFPLERTYSEWSMSAYNSSEGIASDVFGGNKANVSSCTDCHMKDVNGKGCDKNFAPNRTDLPLHDLTGGNTFVPLLVKDLYPSEVDNDEINAGVLRAKYMLEHAATMNLDVTLVENGYNMDVEIINETGHKLPSGYPEGRRMWINVQAYNDIDLLIYESGFYDSESAILDKNGTKIYEAKLGMSEDIATLANANGNGAYSAGESFHFALNNIIIKDNRIPPRGFTNANFQLIQAAPVGYSYLDGAYSDVTSYNLPEHTHKIVVKLMYQTVSKEFIEFLRDKNVTDNKGDILHNLWVANGKSAPVVMQEKEFFTSTLNIQDFETINSEIKIFPNPSKGRINIQFNFNNSKSIKLDLYNINGSRIMSLLNDTIAPEKQTISFDITELPIGLYIIKFKINERIISKQLILE